MYRSPSVDLKDECEKRLILIEVKIMLDFPENAGFPRKCSFLSVPFLCMLSVFHHSLVKYYKLQLLHLFAFFTEFHQPVFKSGICVGQAFNYFLMK